MRWEYVDITKQLCALVSICISLYIYIHIHAYVNFPYSCQCLYIFFVSTVISIIYLYKAYQLCMIHIYFHILWYQSASMFYTIKIIRCSCQLISSTLRYPSTEFMTTSFRFWWWAANGHSWCCHPLHWTPFILPTKQRLLPKCHHWQKEYHPTIEEKSMIYPYNLQS